MGIKQDTNFQFRPLPTPPSEKQGVLPPADQCQSHHRKNQGSAVGSAGTAALKKKLGPTQEEKKDKKFYLFIFLKIKKAKPKYQ